MEGVGAPDGVAVGSGVPTGDDTGRGVGSAVGTVVGLAVGTNEGLDVGSAVGVLVGTGEGGSGVGGMVVRRIGKDQTWLMATVTSRLKSTFRSASKMEMMLPLIRSAFVDPGKVP